MNRPVPRAEVERFTAALAEKRRRLAKAGHSTRGYRDEDGIWRGGLLSFVRYFWHVLEPGTPFVDGWALEALCEHLEAVTFGDITKFLGNVCPGFMKSLLTDVFWPAWEWGPMDMPHIRYVAFSYSSSLTERDNLKFRDLLISQDYKTMYPHVQLRQEGARKVSNTSHGWKLASSVGGVGTGERGDRIILDDPHNVKESESETVRNETIRWFRESMSSRLNNMETGAKVVIMQRVNEEDVSGTIIRDLGDYCHLMIPMEYTWDADDDGNPYTTQIGWSDPRWRETPEECEGELAWPERFPETIIPSMKAEIGKYGWASQYQQIPAPRGGGIFQLDWWQPAEPFMANGKYPPLAYVVASLDGAFTEDEENDPSALTVWGIFTNDIGYNRAIIIAAWRKWLPFSGPKIEVLPGEHESKYILRTQKDWGLVEWVAYTCNRYKADKLLIENKASGKSAAQALRNSHGRAGWSIELVEPKGDKVARAMGVVASWSQGMIYAPDRDWSEMVKDEMAIFPKHKYDDLTDSATQAIKHLRDSGLLRSDEDRMAEEREAVTHKGAPRPAAYPGFRPMRRA